jgi:hypothetical protein
MGALWKRKERITISCPSRFSITVSPLSGLFCTEGRNLWPFGNAYFYYESTKGVKLTGKVTRGLLPNGS